MSSFRSFTPKARKSLAATTVLAMAMFMAVGANATFGDSDKSKGKKPMNPDEMMVEMEFEPQVDPQPPDCVDQGDGTQICTSNFSFEVTDQDAQGKVTYMPTGLTGSIGMVFNMSMESTSKMRFGPGVQELLSHSGSGWQSGPWHMKFNDGSELIGKIEGVFNEAKVPGTPSTVAMSGKFTVDVVAGLGYFKNTAGRGYFNEYEEWDMFADQGGPDSGHEGPSDGGGPPPDGQGPPGAGPASVTAAASGGGDQGNMSLRLHKSGRLNAKFAGLLKESLASDSDVALTVVTQPGTRCKAYAKKGKRKVGLGRARANSQGRANFKGKLVKKLRKAGTWKVKAKCSRKKGKNVKKTVVNGRVKIA